MSFTVSDWHDMVQLLEQRPDWREELRRLLLADDFLALPKLVRELIEAQKRTEQRVQELAEAQQHTEQRVQELAEAQQHTGQRVQELAEAQQHTGQHLAALAQRVEELAQAQIRTEETLRVLADRQNQMRGDLLEYKYAQRAAGYFGNLVRRIRLVLPNRLDPATEDNLEAHLTHMELVEVLNLDVLAVGRLRQPPTPDQPEVWLAVEVSAMIDRGDVERAQRRAALLRKAGYRAVPVVAGVGLTPEATELLKDVPVALVLDGRSQGWEQALAAA